MGYTFGISLEIGPKFALKEIRKQKHLSRRELAEKSGVNEQTIRFLEEEINDPTNAKLSTLVKLARALKCRVKDFYPCEKTI
ncbi:MAG: helix-turn-helix transcriptional regulator [Clostridia bacterium]|nr:helix-turn-helix transcriptional regulator [Clostridia bacterium]MBR3889373.1 helix-turn-helix transcriptional regulator [bacterium]